MLLFQENWLQPDIAIRLAAQREGQPKNSLNMSIGIHWKKKWSHFDLESWVTGGTKNSNRNSE